MLRVGLTGGVACGKSSVGQMFVARGAHLVQADQIAHQLMEPGTRIHREIIKHFGSGVVHQDGSIDRKKLADAVFGTGRIQELNRIVHPAVIARQDEWMAETGARDPQAIVIVEAALILEAGARARFDKLIVVTCRPEQKAPRFARRQQVGLAEAAREVERRSAAQWPDEEKIAAADYVIDNSGPVVKTERQVDEVYAELKRIAAASTQPR